MKNAGKTTVLNALIDSFPKLVLAISSIGMDGEPFDNVTRLPKPRIQVRPGFLVATTEKCLAASDSEYELLYHSGIRTPLGEVLIVRILTTGFCLVAGPSSVSDMEMIVGKLKAFGAEKVFVDGAFSRQSSARLSEAVILVVGANRSQLVDTVVQDAKENIARLLIPGAGERYAFLNKQESAVLIEKSGTVVVIPEKSVITDSASILDRLTTDTEYLYLPNAVTAGFVRALMKHKTAPDVKIIMKSPINYLDDDPFALGKLAYAGRLFTLHKINLVAVCYNPYSPQGYRFDNQEFRSKLKKISDLPLYNVLESEGDQHEQTQS